MSKKAADPEEEKEGGAEGAEGAEGEGAGKKKFSAKKILIIVLPIILLVGGGAGAYFSGALDGLLGKKAATEGSTEAGGEHAAAEGGKGGEHGEGGPAGPLFLKVADEKGQDLIVNLSSADGQPRFLQLGVQLELASPGDVDKVKAVMPRVIDQFQTYLRELRIKDLRGSAGIYRLQMELLARVNQAAAPVQVKDVLFEKILIQ